MRIWNDYSYIDSMREAREQSGRGNSDNFRDAETVFRWWTENHFNVDQLTLF